MITDQEVVEALRAPATASDGAVPELLMERLAAGAERAGLLDVAYRKIDSPIGPLLLAATSEGLVRVAFESEGDDVVLGDLALRVSPRILRSPARLDPVARQLDEYFASGRHAFDVAVDLRLAQGFRAAVLRHLATIPYGTTQSYATVAAAAGSPAAVRAAGSACSHNPVPVIVPCHRVVRSDGAMGRYLGGVEAKRALLDLESGRPARGPDG